MKIKIEKIVYPGKSLGRNEGKVVFTNEGLPGETAEIVILKETKSYTQGQTTGITDPSPQRVLPRCSHYQVCSGYQYIDYPQQVNIKIEQIKEMFARQLKISDPNILFRQSPKIWGYRNKIKLKIIKQKGVPRLAYNLVASDDNFVDIDECFLGPELINTFLREFIQTIAISASLDLNQITVKQNTAGELLLGLYHESDVEAFDIASSLKNLFQGFPVKGAVVIDEKNYSKTVIHGDDFFSEILGDKTFFIGTGSFFQVNIEMLKILIADLENNLSLNTDTILADLYCGVGTFALIFAEKVKKVIAIDVDPENFFFLEKNLAANNIKNVNVRMCDCKDVTPSLIKQKVDTVIVDPPRTGLDAKICKDLAASNIANIVYISCDLATLTRDLKILTSSYTIQSLYAYDFFPHTPHMEIMVSLSRQ